MQPRSPVLPPRPDRPPYFRVVLSTDLAFTMRAPSLHKVGVLLKAVSTEQQSRLLGLGALVARGESMLQLAATAPDVLELFAGLVGVAWADPEFELDTPPWTEGDPAAYGAAVYEELHEQGWSLKQIVSVALAIVNEIGNASEIDAEVRRQAERFLPTRALTTESGSKSAGHSSAGDLSES